MPMDWQTVDVKFTDGQDTATHPKLVMPGKWRELINMSTSKERTPQMRDGLETLASTTGHGLFTRDAELLVASGPTVTSISTGANAGFAAAGRLGYVGISKTEVRRTTGFQTMPDCAYGNGFTCYVWQDRGLTNSALLAPCKLTLVDEATGTHILDSVTLKTPTGGNTVDNLRVIFTANCFFVFYRSSESGTSTMYCRVISVAAPSVLGAETALIANANLASLNWDVCVFNSQALVYYAWGDGVTSTRAVTVITIGTTPAIFNGPTNITTQANLPVAGITALACCPFASGVNFGLFVQSTGAAALSGVAGTVVNTVAAITAGPTRLNATVGATTAPTHLCATQDGAGRIRIFWDYVSERGTNVVVDLISLSVDATLLVNAGPTAMVTSNCFAGAGNPRGQQGPWIHGKAFTSGGRVLLPVYVESTTTNASLATSNPRTFNAQNTFFVLDCGPTANTLSTGAVVATALRGTYGVCSLNGTAPPIATPCSSPAVPGGFATLSGELTLLVITSSATNISPTGLVRLTMTPNTSLGLSKTQLGESAYVASGSLSAYDGAGVVEQGFELYPEGISVIANAAGTGSVTDGTHQLCVIYEWIDGAGQRHQSAPSPTIQLATAGGPNTTSYTVRVPTLQLSQKTNVVVVVFMTQAGGVTFNRVGVGGTVTTNDTTTNFVSVLVTDSDATIAGNELLYNQPNNANTTLANIAPGPCSAICVAHNRLWFDVADQQNAFGYSQEYLNNVGLQFNPALGDRYDASGGTFKNIAAMDEKVIIFCARKLFVVFGQGPQPNGSFSNYTHPEEIQSDVGCLDPRSVVKIPQGILFKATKGWSLLGRDLTVKYVGDGAAYTALGSNTTLATETVYAAVMLEDRHECRLVINNENNYAFCFDYLDGQWSSFFVSGLTPNFSDAVWWSTLGAVVYATASGGIVREKASRSTDGILGSLKGISWTATTGFFHLSSMEGFQRARRFLLSGSSSNTPAGGLTFSVFYDDEPTTPSYSVFFDCGAVTFPSLDAIDIRHRFHTQKCKSVALSFVWNVDAFSGPAPMTGIEALALELGIKRGPYRLPAAQNAT